MNGAPRTVLHYLGYDQDAGGIVSMVRALAATGQFDCVLGLNRGATQRQSPPLAAREWPSLHGERIGPLNFWRARTVARLVRDWLREDPARIFHGHSRAGLLVGLWLNRWGEKRVVVSVHCYGRKRWFYRHAGRRLGAALFWLTPQMRRYYGAPGREWDQCLPGGVTDEFFALSPAEPLTARLRLGGAGELSRWKGWELVPEALALLPAEIRAQVSFEHIGSATPEANSQSYAVELRQVTEQRGVAGQVVWRGQEPSSQRLLGSIDVLVVTSREEPYSMIIQESLAAGVPVLARASGGPLDVIQSGRNGWLFSGGAPALAVELEKQVRTRAWAALDREAIRKTARRASTAAAEWSEVYDRISS